MEIKIINDDLFRDNAPIKEATLASNFINYINVAQIIYIKPILGNQLFTELQAQIKEATETPAAVPYPITPENQALIMEVAPALSWYSVYQGLPFHWAAIQNKGVTIGDSENSKGIDMNSLAQMRRYTLDTAQALQQSLIDYLCRCAPVNYPLWDSRNYCASGCGCDGAKYSPFDSGIFIPRR